MTRAAIIILASVAGASLAAAWRSHVELARTLDTIEDAREAGQSCRDALTRAQARISIYDELLGLARDERAKKGTGGP